MRKREDGQSLVEFALVLPLILLLIVGIVDFGRVLYTQQQLELITQEAVRLGGFGESDTTIRTYIREHFNAGDSSALTITITPSRRDPGDYITVHVAYPADLLTLLGEYSIPYTIETSSTIRVE
ncbi:TadE/TadG family type IV pilus assembly protein [Alteribacillus iranensis]|uniref:TadE-like protein n=1 Tax=Alteribacillus iranensis TaxID=930128 RepID=A0A1I2EV46_9BACI|nr:TadE/TadG family type IV pilus assembly protein [Alteribacillus iranensis]SFE96603.1 TadE-like protein [Alteribacillus iranensis]